jgi:hypothetical protein
MHSPVLFQTPEPFPDNVDRSQRLNGELIKMLRRTPYYFLIVAAVVFIWVKGTTYVHEARLGLAATL